MKNQQLVPVTTSPAADRFAFEVTEEFLRLAFVDEFFRRPYPAGLVPNLAATGRTPIPPLEDFVADVQRLTRVRQIADALKSARIRCGLTVQQVAEKSGVDKSVISRFENESLDFSETTLLPDVAAVWAAASDYTVNASPRNPFRLQSSPTAAPSVPLK